MLRTTPSPPVRHLRPRRMLPAAMVLLIPTACGPDPAPSPTADPPEVEAESTAPTPVPAWPHLRLPPGASLALAPGAEEFWSVQALAHAPRRFVAAGWADARTLWGLAGGRPWLVPLAEPRATAWEATAWDAALAPAGGALAWLDERGVWIGPRGQRPRLALPRGAPGAPESGDLSGPLLWSPDGDRLLVRWVEEWTSTHGVLQPGAGSVALLPTRLDGYALTEAFGWLDPQRVLFATQAMRGRDGRAEYREAGGYRTDLAVHHLEDGSYRLVTSVPDGVFLRPLARRGGHGVLVGEAVGEDRHRLVRYWIYDTRDWSRRPLPLVPGYQAAAHDTLAVLVVDREAPQAADHRLWLHTAGQPARPLALARGRDLRVHWSPDGTRIAVGTVLEDAGTGQSRYQTWILASRETTGQGS